MSLFDGMEENTEDEDFSKYFNTETVEEKSKIEEQPQEDYKQLFEQQKAEIENLKRKFEESKNAFPVQQRPVFEGLNNTPPLSETFEKIFLEKGMGAALETVYNEAKKSAFEISRNNTTPVAAANARFAIEQFKKQVDFTPDIQVEFDSIVAAASPELLASIPAEKFGIELERAYAQAVGQAAIKGRNTRKNNPPTYFVGTGAGGQGGGGNAFTGRRPSEKEKLAFDSAVSYGLSEAEAAAIVKEMRGNS